MGLEYRNFSIPQTFKLLAPTFFSFPSLTIHQSFFNSHLIDPYFFTFRTSDPNSTLNSHPNQNNSSDSHGVTLSSSQGKNFSNSDQSKRQQKSLNIGNAIRILSDDIPGLLQKSHNPDYSIYTEDIKFIDRTHSLSLQGLIKYQMLWKFGKRMVSLLFKEHKMEITKMSMLNDSTLAVRWKFVGTKRLNIKNFLAYEKPTTNSSLSSSMQSKIIEGYSYYKFNDEGFVREHALDQIEPPLQRWKTLKAWFWWIGRLPDTSFHHQCKQNSQ